MGATLANTANEMRGSQKEVTSIETTFPWWAVFSLWFVCVGRVIHAQTMVQRAAFGCNNKSSNPDVEGSGRIHSFHSFPIKWLY